MFEANSLWRLPFAFLVINLVDNAACRWFFDLLFEENNIEFDIIGLSYYNWWPGNGPIAKFQANMEDLATRYEKDLLLLETAYPWTSNGMVQVQDRSKNADHSHDHNSEEFLNQNIVEYEYQLLSNFPPTKEGQWSYLLTLRNIIADLPDNRGLGLLYWEPEWIVAPQFGSKWENLALFDDEGTPLPAFAALGEEMTTYPW